MRNMGNTSDTRQSRRARQATLSRTIGIVEDDQAISSLLVSLLEEEGYQTFTAGTVADTIAILSRCVPAVLLLDVLLPDGDTGTLVSGLRARGVPMPPTVLLSAGSQEQIAEAQAASRAVAALSKPFDVDAVVAVLERLIEHRKGVATLEHMLATLADRGRDIHALRCPSCRWLLYVGAMDFVSGIFSGKRYGTSVVCPVCATESPLSVSGEASTCQTDAH